MANDGKTVSGIETFVAGFHDDPGYLDFARLAPVGDAVVAEARAMIDLLSRARFGSLSTIDDQDARVREAVAALVRARPDQVVFQASASQAFLQVMFGLTGGVAVSSAEHPAVRYAMSRAAEALGVLVPHTITPEHERVTPGVVRDQLSSSVIAVVVSLVDHRTGHLVDLDGIRQVIGERLLIVDAGHGAGIVDAPWELADVIVSGGQTWLRASLGTGFLVLSDRARDQLTPVWSGWPTAKDASSTGEVQAPANDASAFSAGEADAGAQARLAGAIDAVLAAGVSAIGSLVIERTARIMQVADEAGIEVVSPRDDAERAGIVTLAPHRDSVSALAASLHNHGVSATVLNGRVRLSAHVSTTDETVDLLSASFAEFQPLARG